MKPKSSHRASSRALDVTATVLSLGANKLVAHGTDWLKRKRLLKYVVPVLLLNEGLGAYRAYLAGGALGLW